MKNLPRQSSVLFYFFIPHSKFFIPFQSGRFISNRSRVLQYQCGEAMRPMVNNFSVRTRFFSASNSSSRRRSRLIKPITTRFPPICSVPHSTHSRLAGDSAMRGGFTTDDGAAAITGQVIYVDCGYQIMGM